MAKKTRIDRRGTIRPLVTRFPPVVRLHWKKRKVLAAINNRRQWLREFDPAGTAAYEIEMEHLTGVYLITQGSDEGTPNYIITE
jgi:hypothetical protein